MAITIPTSMFGVIAFLIVASYIVSNMVMGFDNTSNSQMMIEGINSDMQQIQEVGKDSANSTSLPQESHWYSFITDQTSAITNTAKVIFYGFNIILEYIFLPFYMFADLVIELAQLPTDLETPIALLIGTGVISGIALFIRGMNRP